MATVAREETTQRAPRGRAQQVFQQALLYGSGSGLTILASLISFPALTRALSLADYGLMAIVSTTINVAVAVAKLGLQNAAVRFYAEYDDKGDRDRTLRSTLTLAPFLNAVAILSLIWLFCGLLPDRVLAQQLSLVIAIAAPILVCETVKLMLLNFMRAARTAGRFTTLTVVDKYGVLVAALAGVIFWRRDLVGYYSGWLAWSLGLTIFLVVQAVAAGQLRFGAMDRGLLGAALRFSSPLMFMELGNLVLTYGDRYLVARYLGASATGIYAAAYNFSMAIQSLLIVPLSSVVFPWASEIWTRDGKAETSRFASQILNYYLVVAIPVVLGVSVLRQAIMVAFASSKYNDAAGLLPTLMVAMVLFGVYQVTALALFLEKRTITMAVQLVGATVLNMAANFWVIPRWGLLAAALTTAGANLALIAFSAFTALPRLPMRLDVTLLARSILAGAVMYAAILLLPAMGNWATLAAGVSLGTVVYCGLMLMLDRGLYRLSTRLLTQRSA